MDNFTRFNQIIDETIENIRKLAKEKGGEYAGDHDRLANFRRNGIAQDLPMESIWGVYAGKHWDAIQQYVKDCKNGTTRPRSEPITGRMDDLIVYLLLGKLMWEERNQEPKEEDGSRLQSRSWIVPAENIEEYLTLKRKLDGNYRETGYVPVTLRELELLRQVL